MVVVLILPVLASGPLRPTKSHTGRDGSPGRDGGGRDGWTFLRGGRSIGAARERLAEL